LEIDASAYPPGAYLAKWTTTQGHRVLRLMKY